MNKQLLAFFTPIILFFFFVAPTASGQNVSTAAMFRDGPSHSGVYAPENASVFGGLQWRYQTGGMIHGTPTVAEGVVYLGSEDGFLYAIDAVTGDLRWKFDAHSPIDSSAAIVEGAVYFGGRDGRLWSIATATGKQLWVTATGPDMPLAWGHESGDFITSSPTVVGEQILFGSGDGFLYSVQRRTGRVQWKFKTGGRVRSSAAVDEGTVYVGSQDGKVYAIELKSGAQKWVHETEGASLDSSHYGFDRRTVQSSPAVVGGAVYIGARDGFLYALSAADGHRLWRFDHQVSWVNSSPAVVGGQVYAGSSDGQFEQSVNAPTGAETWRFQAKSTVWGSPAISGNVLYFGDASGSLFAIDRTNGKELWHYQISDKIHSSPVVSNGRVYFGSDDGGVYAVNVAHGPELKRAVYWEETLSKESAMQPTEVVRDFVKDRGFEVLDGAALLAYMNARIADHAPSVVVFAMDRLPDAATDDASGTPIFRRYLDAGGKVVWPGLPPLLWPFDAKQGGRDLLQVNRAAAQKLLGVGFEKGNFDILSAEAEPAGAKWGVTGSSRANWAADPSPDLTVLARDAQGQAAAWVRRYGGPEGTGFVRYPLKRTSEGAIANLPSLQMAADYLPRK
jgi:outer membrane protein assembly factor BamB